MGKICRNSIAKVNLGLHIMGRLSNGYHLLETLFYPVHDLYDEMIIESVEGNGCTIEMPGFGEQIPLEQNLVWKAWRKMADHYPGRVGGIKVVIEKEIPSGAGLGGGSSNAATVMLAVNELYQLELRNERLAELAEPLGADVPFFIYGEPLYATGIGNRFEHLRPGAGRKGLLDGYRLVVRPQPWHSGTPEAYAGLDLSSIQHERELKELLLEPVETWKGNVCNDLERSVFSRIPGIRKERDKLYEEGAIYAAMTGSGSAVFGIFDDHSAG